MTKFSTLVELVEFQAENYRNNVALNFVDDGKLRSFSNQEFRELIKNFANGLRKIGLVKGDVVANHSYQNPIWLIVDLGTIMAGGVTVPIFENISNEHLEYEISDSNAKFIFDNQRQLSEISSGKVYQFSDLIALGSKADGEYNFSSSADDLITIIYTSGSTGKPKGVEITNRNLVSQIIATEQFFPLDKSDVALSFLPLAHIFERMVMMFYISQGITIHFVSDVKNLGESLKKVRPTLMTTVPRMLEKVYAKINDGIENGGAFKKFLGKKALKRALVKNPNSPKTLLDKIFDGLVFKKFRLALGGNMKMIICGGAPLSAELERFYNNIGINLFCGYGLTETSPVLAANCPKYHKLETVGKIYPEVELKIAEDGELLAKGPNIMRGYHNQAEKTAEVLKDGWFATGDKAVIDGEGFLKIVGRKKELFKTANGKYVSPVLIEQKIVQNLGFLIGSVVVAEGRKFVSALLFPDFEIIGKTKEQFSFSGGDEEFLQSEKLRKFVSEKIENINSKLDNWEKIQKFHIVSEPISIESGEITPSMKLKRNLLEEKYKKPIEEFYLD
jgi:long-chain acyl-CoA synthetase